MNIALASNVRWCILTSNKVVGIGNEILSSESDVIVGSHLMGIVGSNSSCSHECYCSIIQVAYKLSEDFVTS